MIKLKQDYPKETYRPTPKLKYDFSVKCVKEGLSKDLVLNELTAMWLKGKVLIPQQKGRKK